MSYVELMKILLPTIDEFHTGKEPGKYGFGIGYIEGLGYGHDGAFDGFLSSLFYNPESSVSVLTSFNFFVWNKDDMYLQVETIDEISLNAVNVFK
jgi:D-alanyl-D-alanine carboxypeptidase